MASSPIIWRLLKPSLAALFCSLLIPVICNAEELSKLPLPVFLFNDSSALNQASNASPPLGKALESQTKKPAHQKLIPAENSPPIKLIETGGAIPQGFQNFSSRKQTQIDVYFGGTLLVSTLVVFDDKTVTFSQPGEIFRRLPLIPESEAIKAALKHPLPSNRDKLCDEAQELQCGELSPPLVGVILDIARSRVDLFINPYYLHPPESHFASFLPSPNRHLSSIHLIHAVVSGGDNSDRHARISSHGTIAYGESRLIDQFSWQESGGLILDDLRMEHDAQKLTWAAGTMDTIGSSSPLMSTRSFLGLRVARTLKLRTDLRQSRGSPINFFLNERSRVDVFKDNKLMASQFYSAGNQLLDTTSLPDGSYEIRVQIRNSKGKRSRNYLFTRSPLLPPENHALHFMESGTFLHRNKADEPHQSPRTTDDDFFHAGSRFRIRHNLGGEVELLALPGFNTTLQAGLNYFRPQLLLQSGLLQGSKGSTGNYFNINLQHNGHSLSLGHRRLKPASFVREHPVLRPVKKTDLTFSTNMLGGSLLARFSRVDSPTLGTGHEQSLTYRRALLRHGQTRLDLTFNYTINSKDQKLLLGLRYTATGSNERQSLTTQWLDAPSADDNDGLQLEGRYTRLHRDGEQLTGQTSLFTRANRKTQVIGLHLKQNYPHGSGFAETQWQRQDQEGNTLYSAGADLALVTEPHGILLGGEQKGQSGLVIALADNSQEPYEVRINNQIVPIAGNSRKRLILLKPYQQYDVNLMSRGSKLVRFDSAVRKVTLYPGNIEHLDWTVSPVFVVVGQAIHPDHSPVSNSRITNVQEFSGTDENGWFQVELSAMETLRLKTVDGSECRIDLPEKHSDEEVVVLDHLLCEPQSLTASAGTFPTDTSQ